MSRIRTEDAIRASGDRALIGYLPVGYPDVPVSLDAMEALCRPGDGPGVDLVEIGMPYSDPVMDGVGIQQATTRALHRGVKVRDVFAAVERVAGTGTPAVVMIYWNLVEHYGVDAFARDLAAAGGSGLITPDLTPDEVAEVLGETARSQRCPATPSAAGPCVGDRDLNGYFGRGLVDAEAAVDAAEKQAG